MDITFSMLAQGLACATRGGVLKRTLPLLTQTLALSFSLHALLLAHFGGTQDADFWCAPLF